MTVGILFITGRAVILLLLVLVLVLMLLLTWNADIHPGLPPPPPFTPLVCISFVPSLLHTKNTKTVKKKTMKAFM